MTARISRAVAQVLAERLPPLEEKTFTDFEARTGVLFDPDALVDRV